MSPTITPYCCLRILLCYLYLVALHSTLSLNNGIVTLTNLANICIKLVAPIILSAVSNAELPVMKNQKQLISKFKFTY